MNDTSTMNTVERPTEAQREQSKTGTESIKILYIAGLGRSGSTLIDSILGQTPGFFSVGEIHRLWDSGPIYDRVCGCGVPLIECEVWSQILEEAFGGPEGFSNANLAKLKDRGYRTRHLPRLMMPDGREWIREALGPSLEQLERLYRATAELTNSRVIVDSSKFPSYGFVLDSIPTLDVYIVHLMRDPRAVAYSWKRDKFDPGTGKSLGTMAPAKTASLWLSWNYAIERLWRHTDRYLALRYEDFVAHPRASTELLLSFVDEGMQQPSSFVDEGTVKLAPSHSVCGNPIRFDQGETRIKLDTRWQNQLDISAQWVTTAIDWPMMNRYGYSINPASAND